jgi:hypothetical protein
MIEKQNKRDEMIFELLDAMNEAYDFVDHSKPLRIDDLGDTRKEIVKKLLQQTYDCAWFIRDYTSRGFCESIFLGVSMVLLIIYQSAVLWMGSRAVTTRLSRNT